MITEEITETIEESQLPRLDIETLVETKLPPSPGNAMRVINLLRDINSSTRQVTEAIMFEPVLVTRILRIANSPQYSFEQSISSIQTAINAIGLHAIHDIVLMEMTSATFSSSLKNSPFAKKIWNHSIAVAIISKEIGGLISMHGKEEAFTCGLLHDLGKLILLSNDLAGYSQILEENDEEAMMDSENDRYGFTHSEVGSLVANRWGLPDSACYSILYHHEPAKAKQAMLVAHVIELADSVANARGFGLRSIPEEDIINSASMAKLNLPYDEFNASWERISNNINEMTRAFG